VLEVCHVIDQLLNRDTAGETATPRLRPERAENQELSLLAFPLSKGINQLLDLDLVRDQHLTDHVQAAGLPQHDQANRFDVNDERNFANACLGFTARTSRESLTRIGIEYERISRRKRAHPRPARSLGSRH
jgi:hypothetical protein